MVQNLKSLFPYNFLFIFFFSASILSASAQHIEHFEGTPEELFKYAKKKKKPIIIDFYTSWCGYCKKLDKTTFIDPEVVKQVNKDFIMYKLDAESANGRPLAQDNQITGYPCIIFYDKNGNVTGRINGYVGAPKFLVYLAKLRDVQVESAPPKTISTGDNNIPLTQLFSTQLDSLRQVVLSEFNEDQQTQLLDAEKFGEENNIFEFDELHYTIENQENNKHIALIHLFYSMGQGSASHVNNEMQKLFDEKRLSTEALNYFSLYLLTHHKANLLALQMINEASLNKPNSFEIQLTKTAIQKYFGDNNDAKDTGKKAKKIASKNKLDASIIDVILGM